MSDTYSAWENFKLGVAGTRDLANDALSKLGLGERTTYAAQELASERRQHEGLSDVEAGTVERQLAAVEAGDGFIEHAAGTAIVDVLKHPIDTLASGASAAAGGAAAAVRPFLPGFALVAVLLLAVGATVVVVAVRR